MIPILLGSVIGLAIIIEKFWSLWSIQINTTKFSKDVFSRIRAGQLDVALRLCSENLRHPIAKIFKVGIEKKDFPVNEIERTLERIGAQHVNDLEKYLGGLISIIGIEPLLGFLGTKQIPFVIYRGRLVVIADQRPLETGARIQDVEVTSRDITA